jgi:hypothetical protein
MHDVKGAPQFRRALKCTIQIFFTRPAPPHPQQSLCTSLHEWDDYCSAYGVLSISSAACTAPSTTFLSNHSLRSGSIFLNMATTYTGSCICGTLTIEMQGEPDVVVSIQTRPISAHILHILQSLCHCHNCRKLSGSTYSTNAIFSESKFTVVSGEPKEFSGKGGSGNVATISFCGDCSSLMWVTSALRPEMVVVKAGVLDGDALEKLVPKGEMFTVRRPCWVKSVDGAGQFEQAFSAPPSQ